MTTKNTSEELLETLSKQKEYAETANHAKSHFLATISHELRTPLNALLGMAQILQQQKQLTPEEQRECIDTIYQSGHELLELIDDILDFSRLDTEKVELESKTVNLQKVITRVVQMNGLKASRKNLHLVLDYNKQAQYFVQGDPHRIRQILDNLIDNAIKFTEHGEISINISQTNKPSPQLHIKITDTGIGIPANQLKNIFEELKDTQHHLQQPIGAKLGLKIAKRLATLMGGELTAKSLLKKGSCFTLTLPLADANTVEEETSHDLNLAERRILVIDDSLSCRNIIEKRLLDHQAIVTSLAPDAALNNLRNNESYDIVLVSERTFDHHVGRIARNLKSFPILKNTLLVFAAGAEQLDHEIEQALVAGYGCVVDTQNTQNFISQLETSWKSWSEKIRFSVAKKPLEKKRVLLVEDNILNQKVVKMMLSDYGCTVDVAETGHGALKLLGKNHYALVLMDIGLPDISGLDVTAQFRHSENNTPRTPILALTAHALKVDEEMALAAGMDSYLVKPLVQTQLQALLQQWMVQ